VSQTNTFILYQEHSHDYAPHHLVASRKEQALPTRIVTFHPATTDELGNIHKRVRQGYSAWLVPALPHASQMSASFILALCTATVSNGHARKIA
jgi:hypothetical protein